MGSFSDLIEDLYRPTRVVGVSSDEEEEGREEVLNSGHGAWEKAILHFGPGLPTCMLIASLHEEAVAFEKLDG